MKSISQSQAIHIMPEKKILITYVFFETIRAIENIKFFITNGVFNNNNVQYHFIIKGNKCSVKFPDYKKVVPINNDKNGEPVSQGLIINLIDQRVKKLTPEFTSYTIAKMGLWALTQTSAQALAPNIRVNAIGPGPTLKGVRQSEEHFENQRKNTVLGRGSDPTEIVAAVGYLLDAKSVTGQLICVDGGQHLAWQTPDVLGVEYVPC